MKVLTEDQVQSTLEGPDKWPRIVRQKGEIDRLYGALRVSPARPDKYYWTLRDPLSSADWTAWFHARKCRSKVIAPYKVYRCVTSEVWSWADDRDACKTCILWLRTTPCVCPPDGTTRLFRTTTPPKTCFNCTKSLVHRWEEWPMYVAVSGYTIRFSRQRRAGQGIASHLVNISVYQRTSYLLMFPAREVCRVLCNTVCLFFSLTHGGFRGDLGRECPATLE